MMTTYGAGIESETYHENKRRYEDNEGNWVTTFFKYTDVFANHFKFRHAVDDNNNLHHKVPSIEETWVTYHWENRVFAFLLVLSEVNAFLAFRFFFWKSEQLIISVHDFRKKLTLQLIHNEEYEKELGKSNEEGRRNKRQRISGGIILHTLMTAPTKAHKFDNCSGKWICSAKDPYQRHGCNGLNCTERTRKYCSCLPGYWLCHCCHTTHSINEMNLHLCTPTNSP